MILKILNNLKKFREIILLIMVLPIFFIFIFSNAKFILTPLTDFTTFRIDLYTPEKTASEIEQKVTEVAEKVFNGLPSLLNLESITTHENATINLKFKPGTSSNKLFLFVQEKIDRLKIMLPADVKKIKVQELHIEEIEDLNISITNQENFLKVKKKIKNIKYNLLKITPPLDQSFNFKIELDSKKLKENNLGIDSVWKALKINSFTYNIGAKNDLIYFVDGEYKSLEDLKSIIIGEREQHIIQLRDVAQIKTGKPTIPKNIKLWYNPDKFNLYQLYGWASESLNVNSYHFSKLATYFKNLLPIILILIVLVILQIFFAYKLYRNKNAVFSFFVLNMIGIFHYIFWVSIFNGTINLYDLYAMSLFLVFTSFMWLITMGQIRKYFYPSSLHTFIQRTLDQAVIFTLNQFLPLFLYLMLTFWILSLPITLTRINSISKYIIEQIVFFGFPISIMAIVLLALFSPLEWIENKKQKPFNFKYQKSNLRISFYIILLIALICPYSILKAPIGIFKQSNNYLEDLNQEYRSYSNNLEYLNSVKQTQYRYDPLKSMTLGWVKNWVITPNGLSSLAKIDLNSFKMALSDFLQQKTISIFKTKTGKIPITSNFNQNFDLGTVPIGLSNGGYTTIDRMSSFSYDLVPNKIFRMSLNRNNIFYLNSDQGFNNFKAGLNNPKLTKSLSTIYFLKNYQDYLRVSIFSLIFFFFLTSVYLNSFLRAFILSMIGLASSSLYFIVKILSNNPIHLDSLWLISTPFWLSTGIILAFTLPMDIERRRGNDIYDVIDNVGQSTFGILNLSGYFISLYFIAVGALSFLFLDMGQNYYLDALWLSVILLIITVLSPRLFFKLYYVNAQITIERFHLKLMKKIHQLMVKR